MRFYEKYYKNCYEELLTYYPDFYKNVYEMNEILKAFGSISDDLENAVEQAYLDNFILTADDKTIKIWENILGIVYREKLSLEQRRCVIIGYLSGGKHIGEQEIRALISTYTSKLKSIDYDDGTVKIDVDGEIFDEENLLKTLFQRIPAHLRLDMNIHINRKFRYKINFAGLGSIKTNSSGVPPDKRHFSGHLSSSGGLFCRTHTTSKLISQE